MDNRLQKGINEIKELNLTADEKNRIFASVINSGVSIKPSPKSSWVNYTFFAKIQKNHIFSYGFVVLFILLTTSGIVFASTESLPDSILYPIKVSVVEPIISKLKFSQEDKAQYESSLASTRMVEAEILAKEGKLNSQSEKKINALLADHTNALNNALVKISQAKSSGKVAQIVASFNDKMNAHAQALDNISAKVNNNDNHISESARVNANRILSSVMNNNIKGDKKENGIQKDPKILDSGSFKTQGNILPERGARFNKDMYNN